MNPDSPGDESDIARRLQCPLQDRNSTRGKSVQRPVRPAKKVDIWEIKPPDFSYKLYTSLRLPQIPTRPTKEEKGRNQSKFPEAQLQLPSIRSHPKKAASPKFVTRFPHPDLQKAKLLYVRNGKFPAGVYINPKPHEFRQYQSKSPNFVTTFRRDPLELNLKSQLLSTVPSVGQLQKADQQKDRRQQFITHKSPECSWDARLILSKPPWPIKSASFTRHRRCCDAYSAFLDRVEEKWARTHKSRELEGSKAKA
ncbi:uncharacterized protein LOC105941669 isoform X2 [Ochotona princeps]|uniref:uncharacterized protein LOC105941669 isoform X2 n=1 Tax=Ochotona princeps TaxID=9978 RepID=UPI002714ADE2|nr:uncharacterized protein LOC105941669 isoform X2 [Ochotona princeps]